MTCTRTGPGAGCSFGAATAVVGGAFPLRPRDPANRFSGNCGALHDVMVRVVHGHQLLRVVAARIARAVPPFTPGGVAGDRVHALGERRRGFGEVSVLPQLRPRCRRPALSSSAASAPVLITARG